MTKEEINKAWQRFVKGDREAFGDIYKAYFPMLMLFCLGKLKDMSEAENCASETMLKAMSYEKPEEIRELEPWLFRIARNLCYTFFSQTSRHQDIVKDIHKDKKNYHAPEAERNERWNEYEKVLRDNVKDQDRTIWKLHMEGYSNKEISEHLDMQEKTVANRKSEIRRVLRELLKGFN